MQIPIMLLYYDEICLNIFNFYYINILIKIEFAILIVNVFVHLNTA